MHVYKYLNQTVRRIGESNGKSFRGLSKKKKATQEEIQFQNWIQDWVFTTFYGL